MDSPEKPEAPIIRLTRWSVTLSAPDTGKNGDTTVYGVDAGGKELVYAQIPSERWAEWSKTDPLWIQAQKAVFQPLLSDPKTRDTVIRINMQVALEKGDDDMVKKLWNALSEFAKGELMAKLDP